MKQACGKCGTEHEPEIAFCSYCGSILGRPAAKWRRQFSGRRIAISLSLVVLLLLIRAAVLPVENTPDAVAGQFARLVGARRTSKALPLLAVSSPGAPRLIDEYWIRILGEKWAASNGPLQRVTVESVAMRGHGREATVALNLEFRQKQAHITIVLTNMNGRWQVQLPSLLTAQAKTPSVE
jgi:hypothetical protein